MSVQLCGNLLVVLKLQSASYFLLNSEECSSLEILMPIVYAELPISSQQDTGYLFKGDI